MVSEIKTQKQTASKHLKTIRSNIKGLNFRNFVKIIKILSKNFDHLLWLLCRNIFSWHLFSEHRSLDTCLIVNYFLMNIVNRSFNFSNLISSHLHEFFLVDILKELHKIHRKASVLECLLIKIQVSNLQSGTLI